MESSFLRTAMNLHLGAVVLAGCHRQVSLTIPYNYCIIVVYVAYVIVE